jgi:hypothetical protein
VAEAATELVARLGARVVEYTGVDGTTEHHEAFAPRVRRDSLSSQFEHLAEIERDYEIQLVGLPAVMDTYRSKVRIGGV